LYEEGIIVNESKCEVREVNLADLISFKGNQFQTYEGDRLNQLMESIERVGLLHPIIVRPVKDGKFEIICGHNRVKAMEKLGHTTIMAEVRTELSDEEAIELFYDSNLNQQTFSDWNYSQKIEAVRYIVKMIEEHSQQGKRTDLDVTNESAAEGETSVQGRHKSSQNVKRENTRDRMSRRLGISTATMSKYRSIINLPDDLVKSIIQHLDQKKIPFEAAYRMSKLHNEEIEWLLDFVDQYPDEKIDIGKLKKFCSIGQDPNTLKFRACSPDLVRDLMTPKKPK